MHRLLKFVTHPTARIFRRLQSQLHTLHYPYVLPIHLVPKRQSPRNRPRPRLRHRLPRRKQPRRLRAPTRPLRMRPNHKRMTRHHKHNQIRKQTEKITAVQIRPRQARRRRQIQPVRILRRRHRRSANPAIHPPTLPAMMIRHPRGLRQARMNPRQMIILHRVLHQQLPIRRYVVTLLRRRRPLLHAMTRQALRQIPHMLRQRRRLLVQARKHQRTPTVRPHRQQRMIPLVKRPQMTRVEHLHRLRVRLAPRKQRSPHALAAQIVSPAVIRAANVFPHPRALRAQARAAMTAHIQKSAQLAVFVAGQKHRAPGNLRHQNVARILHPIQRPGRNPIGRENPLPLGAEIVRIPIGVRIQCAREIHRSAGSGVVFLADESVLVHGSLFASPCGVEKTALPNGANGNLAHPAARTDRQRRNFFRGVSFASDPISAILPNSPCFSKKKEQKP